MVNDDLNEALQSAREERDRAIHDVEFDTHPKHYLLPGMLFVHPEPHQVTTVLGSCVSVCLWDPALRIGGMNHYLLALWNGEGLPTPRFGSVAIPKLIERLEALGAKRPRLQAKVFGGASVFQTRSGLINVGERNIQVAADLLREESIPVAAWHVGGSQGRRIAFNTETGEVRMKLLSGGSAVQRALKDFRRAGLRACR